MKTREAISSRGHKHVDTLQRNHLYVLFLIALASTQAFAQPYVSRLGRFQVDQKRGCAGLTITLTNLLAGTCVPGVSPCAIDYENTGNPQTNAPNTHTYANPGSYKLTVIYQSLPVQNDDITITIDANTQPNFEMYSCAGSRASIKVIDNKYEQYIIDFNSDGTPEATLPFSNNIVAGPYTYPPPAPIPPPPPFTASVRGRNTFAADNCSPKTQPFTPIATLPLPRINLLTSLNNTSVKLDFNLATNVLYHMEIAVNNSTSFQFFQPLFGVNTLTVPNLDLDNNFYCFRLGTFDACLNTVSSYSVPVCSDKFKVTAVSDANQLTWSTGATSFVTNYSITRNGNNYVTTGTINFNDTNVICKTQYCYQITNNYSGGSRSISLEKCVTTFSTRVPTAVSNVSSVVSGAGVELSWTQDPAFVPVEYSIYRSEKGGSFAFFQKTSPVSPYKFTDNSYSTDSRFCYQINYIDQCGLFSSPGITTCPVRLSGSLDKNNSVTLVWSAYKGWRNGVKNYLIEKYNLQGTLIRTFTVTDTTFVDDQPDPGNQLVRYDIKPSANEPGVPTSLSNLIELIKNANLYYPSAFTPNSDNLNDSFTVSGQFIVKMNLKIFDRWGAILFSTDKNEPWNGYRDGKLMPPSTYVWKADITDLAGRTFSQEGTVVLITN